MNGRRIARLFRAEMGRAIRMRFPLLALAGQGLMPLVARHAAATLAGPRGMDGPGYFAFSMNLTSSVITPILATAFAAGLIASETSRGTLRTLWVRPVSRGDFLVAKLLVAVVFTLVLAAASVGPAAWMAAGMPLEANPIDGELTRNSATVLRAYTIACGLALLPLLGVVCFALAVSAMSASGSTAVSVAVGALLLLEPLKSLLPTGWEGLVVTSHFTSAFGWAADEVDGIVAGNSDGRLSALVLCSLSTMAAWITLAAVALRRKDVTP